MKSCDIYCKRHTLALMQVIWAILRQNRLGGLTSRGEPEKKVKVSDSHRNDVLPLTQGLRYRAACDMAFSGYAVPSNVFNKTEIQGDPKK